MFPLRDANPHRTTPFVTWGLIGVNVFIFIYGLQLALPEAERFLLVYSFVPQLLFEYPLGSAYRLVSSLFLHGGWGHLLGNMFFLFVFGDNIEARLGHGCYFGFYLLGGVAASLLHALFISEFVTLPPSSQSQNECFFAVHISGDTISPA